jgi:quinol monooxygenase YgiN
MLTCIAKITAKDKHKETVLSELSKLIIPTQKEHGCVNYDLHIDNANGSIFIFHENWLSEQDLKAHGESSHIKECFDVIREMLDSVEVSKLTKVLL